MASTSEPVSSPEIEGEQLIRRTSNRKIPNSNRTQIGEPSRSVSEVQLPLIRCSAGASSSWSNPLAVTPVRHESAEPSEDVFLPEEERFVPLGLSIEDIDPVLDHAGRIGGDKTSSSAKTIKEMLNSCGLFNSGVTIVIPREDQRPWNPPEGYICLYEGYFAECRLTFPIPALISRYAHRRRMAICQFVPGAICNFVAALTLAAEVGFNIGVQCFEQLSSFKLSKSENFWEVNMRPQHNFLAGKKVSKFKQWANHYFFVRVDQYSFAEPLGFHRRVWNDNPDRPFFKSGLAPGYRSVRDALLSGNNRRWEFFSRIRVEKAMGKARTNFPSFASSLGRAAGPVEAHIVESSSLQIVRRDTQAAIQAEIEPTQDRTASITGDDPLLVASEGAGLQINEQDVPQLGAGSRKKKKKKTSKGKEIEVDLASEPQPTVNRKRSADDAGLESADQFRLKRRNNKTYQFAFDYFGSTPLTAAKINTLTQLYDRRVKTDKNLGSELEKVKECAEQIQAASRAKDDRIKELEALIVEKDCVITQSGLRIDELNSRVRTLEEEKSELLRIPDELKIKFDSEVRRLRRDRLEKVERTAKKAQSRLDTVKAFLLEQDTVVRPVEDLLNQAKGVEETVQYLIEKGAVIPEEQIAEINASKVKAEEAVSGPARLRASSLRNHGS
ncbi:PREDICTED: uncharacterized protein At3g60930, chloroplastic-like [Camelina sativa]|uniref:Uncharacterized protein At3g60930, chloroplastic-like n=1 Tax=Camelina sativa TaxID=90675 RepID=A0ABM1Q7M3_CAMSA|nr:PREDICTED: uncharacterized protein At3g60930, chloroplastic-like [Camelina sativa]